MAVVALSYIPWILIHSRVLADQAHARLIELRLDGLMRIAEPTVRSWALGTTAPGSAAQLVALAVLALALLGAATLWSSGYRTSSGRLLTLTVLVPVLLAWLTTPLMPFFYARFLMLVTPAYVLLVAYGLDTVANRRSWIVGIGLLALAAASVASLHNYYSDPAYAKGGYGRLMAHIASNYVPGDAIVTNNPDQAAIFDYYAPTDIPAYKLPFAFPLEDPRTDAELRRIAEDHKRVWFVVYGDPTPFDPEQFVAGWLSRNGAKSYHGDYVDAGLDLFVMGDGPSTPERELHYQVGDGALLRGARWADQVVPGETLLLELHWRAAAPMRRRYTVFTHLIDDYGRVWAQMDSEPVGGTVPTTDWQPGVEIWDSYGLELPSDIPAGNYQVEVGMYYLPTLERLAVMVPDDAPQRGDSQPAGATGLPEGDRVLLGAVAVTDTD
jgi:hypothetical protein